MALTHKIKPCSLILLIVTFHSLSTAHASSVLERVCNQTRNHPLCLTVLGSDSRSRTAGLAQLAQIAIDAAEYEAVDTKMKIHELILAARDPRLRAIYVTCENLYIDALAALRVAPDYLAGHRYRDLGAQAVLVRANVDRCGSLLVAVKHEFAKEIAEVGILGDAISIMSQDLAHPGIFH